MQKITLQVPDSGTAESLKHWVCRQLPQVPQSLIRKAFAARDVKVNGQRTSGEPRCLPGWEVVLYLPKQAAQPIPILYQDAQVLLVHKPRGISCDRDGHQAQTLAELVRAQLPQQPSLYPVHRLDNQTSGLVLLACSSEAQEALKTAFQQQRIHKTYLCLVRGTPAPAHALQKAYLWKDAAHSRVKVLDSPRPGAKDICTEYQVLAPAQGDAPCRLEVILHTGRTHQIRAHMAHLGHPLLGDDVYGDRSWNHQQRARQLKLSAVQLSFDTLPPPLSALSGQTFSLPAPF